MIVRALLLSLMAVLAPVAVLAQGVGPVETPLFADQVASGALPPIAQRLPAHPRVVDLPAMGRENGQPGGSLRLLMGDQRDIRMMTLYGYSRLVIFDAKLDIVPDLLESVDVDRDRVFTLHLRAGHKWSDGQPFTTEDFRYWWEDVANDKTLSPGGVPMQLLANGAPPKVEIIDPVTVRYSWSDPNPGFLPALAAASPLYIFMPSHYLRQFNKKYADATKLQAATKAARVRDWGALHERKSRMYRPENPDLPCLEPWCNTTPTPAELFVFRRNPFYHRIDTAGRQLPYIDEVRLALGTTNLIPAKTAAGDSDLQARYIRFEDYTFLKVAEDVHDYKVSLWERGDGAYIGLYPNMNAADPVWRTLMRDVRFRRALSIGIDRHAVNQVLFYGLAKESAATVLPQSPLFKPEYKTAWAQLDVPLANRMLDDVGLTKRDGDGIRLLPDGRRAELIVESAGESTEETDSLELIGEDWRKLGIKMYSHPSHRDVFRQRALSGQTVMSIWTGILDNGTPSADMSPDKLIPIDDQQYQWPKFGQYIGSNGTEGEKIDMPDVQHMVDLYRDWRHSDNHAARVDIWGQMLAQWGDQVYAIGVVNGTRQPVVTSTRLRNVPKDSLYSFEPGAFFGMSMPDTFWFGDKPGGRS